jgi:hypothetical protein
MRELSTTRLTHAPPLRPSSQVSQFAQFIIGDRCDAINAALARCVWID